MTEAIALRYTGQKFNQIVPSPTVSNIHGCSNSIFNTKGNAINTMMHNVINIFVLTIPCFYNYQTKLSNTISNINIAINNRKDKLFLLSHNSYIYTKYQIFFL